MSGPDDMTPGAKRDDAIMAGEYALGLLEGEELLTARGRMVSDPEYAARVEWWALHFAPLSDEIAGMEPSADMWNRISAQLQASTSALVETGAEAGNVVDLTSRLRRWQWTAGLSSAAAALMLALLVFAPGSGPNPAPNAPPAAQIAAGDPLVAQMPIGESGLRLDVTYLPDSEQLLVSGSDLTADGVHDHELWLVLPDGGGVESLGLVKPGEVVSRELSQIASDNLDNGAQILLSREPLGGKPEGVAPGPIVAQGAFSSV